MVELAKKFYNLAGLPACSDPTRHKLLFVRIETLRAKGICFSRVEQRSGETIVVAPRAFHFEYNEGNNLAIAVNFLAMQPKDFEQFRLETVYCDCGEPNLRLSKDCSKLLNFVWSDGQWKELSVERK